MPLPDELIFEVLKEAQLSPSNCNTQPWSVHVVSGEKRNQLSAAIVEAAIRGDYPSDFPFSIQSYCGRYSERQKEQGRLYHEMLSMARDDSDARSATTLRNYHFFDAPHVALLFMPSVGDNVRAAADVGMYAQTFLLALAARGLGGVAQTSLGVFARTICAVLNIPDEMRMLFGISFGYPDNNSPANQLSMGRDPVSECVTFYK